MYNKKLRDVMWIPCLILLLIGCESTITDETKSVENLDSENPQPPYNRLRIQV
jgi:hypothetical protein